MILSPKYIKLLQWLLGVDIDGIWGPQSAAAADAMLAELEQVTR